MTTFRFVDPAKCHLPDPTLKSEAEQLGDQSNNRKVQGGARPVLRSANPEWAHANRYAADRGALVIWRGPKVR